MPIQHIKILQRALAISVTFGMAFLNLNFTKSADAQSSDCPFKITTSDIHENPIKPVKPGEWGPPLNVVNPNNGYHPDFVTWSSSDEDCAHVDNPGYGSGTNLTPLNKNNKSPFCTVTITAHITDNQPGCDVTVRLNVGSSTPTPPPKCDLTISPQNKNIYATSIQQFTATGNDANNLQWSSQSPKCAMIDKITGIATAQNVTKICPATILVNNTQSNCSAKTTLTVNPSLIPPSPPSPPKPTCNLTINQTKPNIGADTEFTFTATGGDPKNLQWSILSNSDQNCATIDSKSGIVKSGLIILKPCNVKISVKDITSGCSAKSPSTLSVNPSIIPTCLSITPQNSTIVADGQQKFDVSGQDVSHLQWSINNNDGPCATIDQNGLAKGIKNITRQCTATISVKNDTCSSVTATLTVNPKAPPKCDLTISPQNASIDANALQAFKASGNDANNNLQWNSNPTRCATIDKITGVATGQNVTKICPTTISVSNTQSNCSARTKLTVNPGQPQPTPQPKPPKQGSRFGVLNACKEDIWMYAQNLSPQLQMIPALTQVDYDTPDGIGFASLRNFAKFGCDSSGNNCKIGQSFPPCSDQDGCQPDINTAVELTIDGNGTIHYDISMVNGFTYPAKVTVFNASNDDPNCSDIDASRITISDHCPTAEDLSTPTKKWNQPPKQPAPKPFGDFKFYNASLPEKKQIDLTKRNLRAKSNLDSTSVIGCFAPYEALIAHPVWGGIGIGYCEANQCESQGSYPPINFKVVGQTAYGSLSFDDRILMYANAYTGCDLAPTAAGDPNSNNCTKEVRTPLGPNTFIDGGAKYWRTLSAANGFTGFCSNNSTSPYCSDWAASLQPGGTTAGRQMGELGPIINTDYVKNVHAVTNKQVYAWQYDDVNGLKKCNATTGSLQPKIVYTVYCIQ